MFKVVSGRCRELVKLKLPKVIFYGKLLSTVFTKVVAMEPSI